MVDFRRLYVSLFFRGLYVSVCLIVADMLFSTVWTFVFVCFGVCLDLLKVTFFYVCWYLYLCYCEW